MRAGLCAYSESVFTARMLEIAKRENKSKVVGLIIGTSGDVRVTMTVHEDGTYTVVKEEIGKPCVKDCVHYSSLSRSPRARVTPSRSRRTRRR